MTKELERHGLCKVGRWITGNHKTVTHLRQTCHTGINYEISAVWKYKRNVVYALVFNASIRYIGETSTGMATRFNGYRYGNPLVTDTDNRVKLAITQTLHNGGNVEIWASFPLVDFKLPNNKVIQVPASKPLEEHLIALLSPDLN